VDSVKAIIAKKKNDTSAVLSYQRLGAHYNVVHLDSARSFLDSGLKLAKEIGYVKGVWLSENTLGVHHGRYSQYDSAYYYLEKAKYTIDSLKSDLGIAIVYNNIATIDIKKGAYAKAIDLMFEALKAEERIGNQNGVGQAYNNIGVCYYYMKDYVRASEYLTKNLEIQEELGNDDGLLNGYGNVAAILLHVKKYEAAIKSYTKALEISRRINDKQKEGLQMTNIALVYSLMNDNVRANKIFKEGIALREKIDDKRGIAFSYQTYGESLRSQGKIEEAKTYLIKSYDLAKEFDFLHVRQEALSSLSDISKTKGN
jgi:tetratricopeptide (TPR) repeat protein